MYVTYYTREIAARTVLTNSDRLFHHIHVYINVLADGTE